MYIGTPVTDKYGRTVEIWINDKTLYELQDELELYALDWLEQHPEHSPKPLDPIWVYKPQAECGLPPERH